jgi:hypothetical protein
LPSAVARGELGAQTRSFQGNGLVLLSQQGKFVLPRTDLVLRWAREIRGSHRKGDPRTDPWFLVHGSRGSGKTSAMRQLAEELSKDHITIIVDVGEGIDWSSKDAPWSSVISRVLGSLTDSALKNPHLLAAALEEEGRAFLDKVRSRAFVLKNDLVREPSQSARNAPLFFQNLFCDPDSPLVMLSDFLERPIAVMFDEYSTLRDKQEESGKGGPGDLFVSQFTSTLRAMKQDPDAYRRLHSVGAFGTFAASIVRGDDSSSPLNVWGAEGIPMLTRDEVRALLAEFEHDYWVDESHRLDMGIADDIHFATGGHAGLVQVTARTLQDERLAGSGRFPTREEFLSTLEGGGILSKVTAWPSIQKYLERLRDPAYTPHRTLLARTYVPLGPNESALPTSDARNLAFDLVSFGVLKNLEGGRCRVAGPLIRGILIREVLPVDYRHYVDKPLPRDPSTGYLDGVGVLQILARMLVQEAYTFKHKKGASGKDVMKSPVPSEVCYQLPLGLLTSQWAGGAADVLCERTFSAEVGGTVGRPDVAITDREAEGSLSYGKTIILELSAHLADGERGKRDAGGKYPNTVCGHIDKCEELYSAAKDVVAVCGVNFTTQPERSCYKPEAALKGTTLVHVRHDQYGKVLGMLVLRPGETKWARPRVPTIEESKTAGCLRKR